MSVINQLNADIHIVAECLDEKHRTLFESVDCDAVVPGMRIIGNLLAQEIHDPGVARMVDVITSNLEGDTLFTTQVGDQMEGADYRDFAKRLLDSDINLMCVNRGQDSHTHYGGMRPTVGDILIYVATRRMSWSELRAMGG